jgi:hypothetical protein
MGVDRPHTKEGAVYAARTLSHVNHREYVEHRRLYERNRNKPQVLHANPDLHVEWRKTALNRATLPVEQFKRCSEPWALSSIVIWLKELTNDLDYLTRQAVVAAIVTLFLYNLPDVRLIDAKVLGDQVFKEMIASGTLVRDEETVRFGPGNTTGVLFQLTGLGCYSPTSHCSHKEGRCFHNIGRCYSHHCMKTLDCAWATRTHPTSWAEGNSQLHCTREGCESAFPDRWIFLSHIRTVHHVQVVRCPLKGCVWYHTKAILAPEHLQKHLESIHQLSPETSTNLVLDASFRE